MTLPPNFKPSTDEIIKISPSQLKSFRRCQRLIGYQYVEKRRSPSTVKQKFGTDVHHELEWWLRKGRTPEDSPIGDTAKQGIKFLPTPSPLLLVEQKFEFELVPGIMLGGFIDCVDPPPIVEKGPVDSPLVIDHKSTGDLKWAMSPEQLTVDEQAIIYALWAMLYFGAPRVFVQWIYYSASNSAKGKRKANGCHEVCGHFDHDNPGFLHEVESIIKDCQYIAHIRRQQLKGKELPPNISRCGDYGGCFFQPDCALSAQDMIASSIAQANRKDF